MSELFVVMCDRGVCSYPVAAFRERARADFYAGWLNRCRRYADYRVHPVPADPLTPAMHAGRGRAGLALREVFCERCETMILPVQDQGDALCPRYRLVL